jgi:prepilin-type N-terminal cleavage/methylation domain-containing protein
MIRRTKQSGFTLIELMIVVAIIAIIAAIAIPRLMSARLAANESAAISTLRSVSSAEAQIQSSGAVDTDADGAGEYAYFAELAGTKPLRVAVGIPPVPAAGNVATDLLNPAIMSSAFGTMTASVVSRQGYLFQLWLPANGPAPVAGIPEDVTGGKLAGPFPGSNNGELMWCCYAWPGNVHKTGNRAFFVNQEGDLLQCLNRTGVAVFTGTAAGSTPTFDDAYVTAGTMGSALRIGTANAAGHIWVPVN